jgi:hypothetical protein
MGKSLLFSFDGFVKSRNSIEFVIPAKARRVESPTGIQLFQNVLGPGFRRGDDPKEFLRDHQFLSDKKNSLFVN